MKKTCLLLSALAMLILFACASADTLTVPEDTLVIAEEAFAGDSRFEDVIFPRGLKEIGPRAFAGCGIDFVYLPDSLEVIGEGAFDSGVGIYIGPDSLAADALDAIHADYAVLILPDSIRPVRDTVRIAVGEQAKLQVICVPSDADLPPLKWVSSNGMAAAVTADGTVIGLKEGTAVIRAESLCGLKTEMTVIVGEGGDPDPDDPDPDDPDPDDPDPDDPDPDDPDPDDPDPDDPDPDDPDPDDPDPDDPDPDDPDPDDPHEPVYRALLVANVHYGYEDANWNAGDIELLKKMFASVTAPNGKPWEITVMYDLTEVTLEAALRNVFAETREGDVSLFHISTHAQTLWRPDDGGSGRFKMPHANGDITYVPLATLRNWMDMYVRGDVVLFIESCSSGSAVDPAGGGAFRDSRFYVLTSCRHQKHCYSNGGKYNYFIQWLTAGVGTSGAMPGDRNGDGAITVGELYSYISRVGDNHRIGSGGEYYYQQACVYPENSGFVLFIR